MTRVVQQRKRYLVDDKGNKTAVVVSIKEYEELLEDLKDLAIIAERKKEPSEPLEIVKKRLGNRWPNTKSK